jgi:predicted phosphodiesterase
MAAGEGRRVTMRRWIFLVAISALLIPVAGCRPTGSAVSVPTAEDLPKASPTDTYLPLTPLPSVTSPAPPTILPTASQPAAIIPGSDSYVRPPTVQDISSTEATIVFELDEPGSYSLYCWADGADVQEGFSIPLQAGAGSYVIELDGLDPDSNYFAAVLSESSPRTYTSPQFAGEIWDPVRVHTLPDGGLPVRIAVLGDSGFGQVLTYDLAQAMAAHEPDLFIHTGDLVYNAGQEETPVAAFQLKFFATLSPILHQAAVFPVVGNHELYDDARWDGRAYYYDVFPMLPGLLDSSSWAEVQDGNREWYRLELGPLQLLFLNTQLFYVGSHRGEQDEWLQERLADEAFSYSIPVFHVPPYTSGRHRLDGTPVVRGWVPLFEENHVPLVLSGHDHNYERLFQNGVTYVVSGGGSTALYQQGRPLDISQAFFAQSHFLILDIESGSIHVSAFNSEGAPLEEFTIELP